MTAALVPVLGDRCMPGCSQPDVDPDGSHYCWARVAVVPLIAQFTRKPCAVAVEVVQEPDDDHTMRRRVELLPLDERGRYYGDGFEVDRTALAALTAAAAAALDLADCHDRTRPRWLRRLSLRWALRVVERAPVGRWPEREVLALAAALDLVERPGS